MSLSKRFQFVLAVAIGTIIVTDIFDVQVDSLFWSIVLGLGWLAYGYGILILYDWIRNRRK